uniref:Protein YIF1 n=1 Tax=Panstrongylus lignarius TaxID=156445 RepID=A0A224XEM5_9HEMI
MNFGNEYGQNYQPKPGPYAEYLDANKEFPPNDGNTQTVNPENSNNVLRKSTLERGYRDEGQSSLYHMQPGYSYGMQNKPPVADFYRPNEQFNQGSTLHSFAKGEPFPGHPLMTDMAFMYGTRIMDTGKEIVDKEINKFVSLNRLKCYFAVDTIYTIKKLKLLLFPYYNTSWSPKVFRGQPALPKEDVNSPDLYIPLMAYITFVLLAGYMIGKQSGFRPEILGVLATQALGYLLIELAFQLIILYITNLQTCLSTWDLVAFSGYKFVGIIVALLMNTLFNRLGYYICVVYCGISLAFFMIRSLKWRMVNEKLNPYNSDLNGEASSYDEGYYQSKRRLYFLLLVGVSQPILMWWHSYNLDVYAMNSS